MKKIWILVLTMMVLFSVGTIGWAQNPRDCIKEGEMIVRIADVEMAKEYLVELETEIAGHHGEIEELLAELEALRIEFARVEDELVDTQAILVGTQNELADTQGVLEAVRSVLTTTYEELDSQEAEIRDLESELSAASETIGSLNITVQSLQEQLAACLSIPPVSTTGVWLGGVTGIPFGVLGTFGYQVNEQLIINSAFGYQDGFRVQVGVSRKIGK